MTETGPLFVSSGDLIADRRYKWALDHVAQGDLAGATKVLAPDGVFAFTVETHEGDGVKLLPTLRYAHGENYVRDALGAARLVPMHLAKADVRSEKGAPVDSLVVVAQHLSGP